ncbi:MAG: UPF0179 family protein [Candidatus Verstraetearchaeota archaeon]|nr:UPF0179 family protein [Candidatus Verstraetearchaeota archaeon]
MKRREATKEKAARTKGANPSREVVTLVGEGQASKGFRFVASRPPDVCRSCKIFIVCMGRLVPGRAYEVVEVKDKQHYCALYEDKVRVAKVVQSPIELLVKPQYAVEGATVTFAIEECTEKSCLLENLCRPEGIKRGEKIRIERVLEDVSEMALCGRRYRKATALVVEPS